MVTIDSIRLADSIIRSHVIKTPLVYSSTFSRLIGSDVYLKLENLQRTGSFKVRGALNIILSQRDQIGSKGVIAASAGNHAQGVALAANQVGISSTIVMPEWASISKQEATRGYGGNVIIYGKTIEESLIKANEFVKDGKFFIHPFDNPDIIAGQGSIALEIFEDLPEPDFFFIPVGGGGLISGISIASKSIRKHVKIIGVQAKACPSAYQAKRLNQVVKVDSESSIADGIRVKQIGNLTFEYMQKWVDDIVLVDEEQIASAILLMLERKRIMAEGAGAVALAAALSGQISIPHGSKVVIIVSGGNADSPLIGRIINKGLMKQGRIMKLKVNLTDTPGSLAGLLEIIARLKANVLHIYHNRYDKDLPLHVICVEIELETRGHDHIIEIQKELGKNGYV